MVYALFNLPDLHTPGSAPSRPRFRIQSIPLGTNHTGAGKAIAAFHVMRATARPHPAGKGPCMPRCANGQPTRADSGGAPHGGCATCAGSMGLTGLSLFSLDPPHDGGEGVQHHHRDTPRPASLSAMTSSPLVSHHGPPPSITSVSMPPTFLPACQKTKNPSLPFWRAGHGGGSVSQATSESALTPRRR
jgi:CubicO group peptidase (beta-lactamase class C family)